MSAVNRSVPGNGASGATSAAMSVAGTVEYVGSSGVSTKVVGVWTFKVPSLSSSAPSGTTSLSVIDVGHSTSTLSVGSSHVVSG